MSMSEDHQLSGVDGAVEAYNLCLGFVAGMVAKAVCDLGIPDILATHPDEPMSALHIVQLLRPQPSRPLQEAAQQLDRMMRCLCAYKVFKAHADDVQDAAVKYSLTPVSNWLQGGSTLHPFLLLQMGSLFQDPWHCFSQSLLHGVAPFTAAHSMDVWELATANAPFNRLLNSGMAASSHLSSLALLQHYDGFQNGVHTLVDVGGGTGTIASSIAARYPSIRVINFDLPTAIATAPIYPGVEHIGGDMFQSVPSGDAIFMKWILHDWNDEDCVKILNNCHKVLSRHGKLIIMEAVLDFTSMKDSPFQNIRVALDMLMLAHTTSGKERTKKQWEVLLDAAKFSIHRIIDLPCPQCIIEAIPLKDA